MAPPDKEVLETLADVGDNLLNYLSSVDQLLVLLDKLENLLSTLDQAPDRTVKEALLPTMKALISKELYRHPDEDVKISVTCCIAEITRITAPEAPYDDEQMKEIFKLTVAAFEKLSHVSSRCYEKALLIVDNVARVRSCLLMMDLECDDLIIEMFLLFLRVIRSNHPPVVTFAMETIMSMVLNESEEISPDLIRPLLESVRKEKQTISPMSWSLGEKVINNCADKLQPYLMGAVQSTGRALDAYADIVVSICQRGSETLICNDSNGSRSPLVQADENKLAVCEHVDEQFDVTKDLEPDMTCVRDVAQTMDDAKPNERNSSATTMDGETIKKKGSKRQPHSDLTKNDKRNNTETNLINGNSKSVEEPKSEAKLDTVPKKRGRKPNSLMNPEEGYDHSWIYMDRKSGKSVQSRKACNSGSDFLPSESPASKKDKLLPESENVGEVSQSKTEKTIRPKKTCENGTGLPPIKIPVSQKDKLLSEPKNAGELSQPKTKKTTKTSQSQSRKACDSGIELSSSENPASQKDNVLTKPENMTEGSGDVASQPKTDKNPDAAHPSRNHNVADRSYRKRGRPKKNSTTNNEGVDPKSASMTKEDHLIAQHEDNSLEPASLTLEKDLEVMKDAVVNAQAPLRKIRHSAKTDEKTAVGTELIVGQMEFKSCEDEEKPKSVMNGEAANIEGGRSFTQTNSKKRRRLNATPNKDFNDSSTKQLITESATKTLTGVEETPQTRRKSAAISVEASEMLDCIETLAGSRIKVWWPLDKRFYEGVVNSYDSVKGKHKIVYVDGDVEVLNLKKQRWERITDHASPNAEEGIDLQQLEAAAASDIAEKKKQNSESESSKGTKANSRQTRGRASARISKSASAKSASKSNDSSLDKSASKSVVADKSAVEPPRTKNEHNLAGKSKTKRSKIVSGSKKNKPEADGMQKKKLRKA